MTEKTPWHCLGCKQLRPKQSADRHCPVCKVPWQTAIDRTYVHNAGAQRQDSYAQQWQAHQQGWGNQTDQQTWNRQRSKSRTQTPRGRRSKSAHSQQRQCFSPSSQKGKGPGKGLMQPMPPPAMPWPGYGMPGPPGTPMMVMQPPMQPSMPQMQMPPVAPMPVLPPPGNAAPVAPAFSMPPPPQTTQDSEQKEFMEMARARQMELPPDMRQKVQRLTKKEGAKATKDLHSAVRNLGVARSDLEEALQARSKLIASWKIFTDAVRTWQGYIRQVCCSLMEAEAYDATIPRQAVCDLLDHLAAPQAWEFLIEVTAGSEHLHSLDLYEQWCLDMATASTPWQPTLPCPRLVFRELIVLHAYSKQGRLEGLFVVSLDLVIDSQWGDIENKETQHFWLNALPSGYIVAMLSGSPCCTWSIARGKQYEHTKIGGRGGPRVLRDLSALWGYHSVSLREKRQLYDGHLLLGFSIHAMVLLSTVGGTGALEHPSNLRIPMQQAFGAYYWCSWSCVCRAFSTSNWRKDCLELTAPRGPGCSHWASRIYPFIRANAVCPHLPRHHTRGIDAQGQFRTAKLKGVSTSIL